MPQRSHGECCFRTSLTFVWYQGQNPGLCTFETRILALATPAGQLKPSPQTVLTYPGNKETAWLMFGVSILNFT